MNLPNRTYLTSPLLVTILLATLFSACDDPSPPPRIEHPVTDNANVLSAPEREALSQRLLDHRARTRVQIALLTIPSTNGEPIEDFSHRTAEAWGGGQAGFDNGVLITLAVQDHRSRIEVGRGLEASLPDEYCHSLLDAARPALRNRDYHGAFDGILNGILARTGALLLAEPAPSPRVTPTGATPAPGVSPAPDVSPDGSLWGWLIGISITLGLGGVFAWMFTRDRKDQKAFQARERERQLQRTHEWEEQRRNERDRKKHEERRASEAADHERVLIQNKVVVQSTPAYTALDALVKQQKERQAAWSKPVQQPYSYKVEKKTEKAWAEEEHERAVRRRKEQDEEERRRRDRDEEEARERRRRDSESSSSSSSSSYSDSGSSYSGSDWGGGGGGFDGGGSSGSW